MTRLTEALERARASSNEGTPRLVPRSGEGAQRPGQQGSSAWQFEEESPDLHDRPEAPVQVPETWQLEPEPAVASVAAVADVPPTQAARVTPATADELPLRTEEVRPRRDEPEIPARQLDLDRMEIKAADVGKLVVGGHAEPNVVEQYRSLAATVHHAQLQMGTRILMISSAVEGEGKTLTSTNLALTLSHSYKKRVLLIDADLRRPSVHQVLQLDNRVGLGDTLKQALPAGVLPVQRVLETLWVITAGQPNSDPMGALVSETMKQFLADAVEQFDWIVIDTPPVALLPDANLLAAMADTALLVVSAGTTPHALVTRAIDSIGRSKILGAVLNRAEEEVRLGYDHLTYAYGHESPKAPRHRWFGFNRWSGQSRET